MIAVIDYGAGNLFSVRNALDFLGLESEVTRDEKEIRKADGLILPGVGAFPDAMEMLSKSGLTDTIREEAVKKPFLGICLGMQMLFDKSCEDGEWEGLGFIPGEVVRFGKENDPNWDESNKIPHMGWNRLIKNREDAIGNGVDEGEYAYFVHSYYAVPENWDDVVYYADYSVKVPGVVRRGNVTGMQFHPEKSSDTGMKLLTNFLKEGEEIAD